MYRSRCTRSGCTSARTASGLSRYVVFTACLAASQVQHEPRAARARHADLHHLAALLLGVAQEVVAVLRLALDHRGGAHAALAALAVEQRVAAVLDQAVEDRLVRGDSD